MKESEPQKATRKVLDVAAHEAAYEVALKLLDEVHNQDISSSRVREIEEELNRLYPDAKSFVRELMANRTIVFDKNIKNGLFDFSKACFMVDKAPEPVEETQDEKKEVEEKSGPKNKLSGGPLNPEVFKIDKDNPSVVYSEDGLKILHDNGFHAQDAFAVSADRRTYCVMDGVSEGPDSGALTKFLANKFSVTKNPLETFSNPDKVKALLKEFLESIGTDQTFASTTFDLCQINDDGSVTVIQIGDSPVYIKKKNGEIISFGNDTIGDAEVTNYFSVKNNTVDLVNIDDIKVHIHTIPDAEQVMLASDWFSDSYERFYSPEYNKKWIKWYEENESRLSIGIKSAMKKEYALRTRTDPNMDEKKNNAMISHLAGKIGKSDMMEYHLRLAYKKEQAGEITTFDPFVFNTVKDVSELQRIQKDFNMKPDDVTIMIIGVNQGGRDLNTLTNEEEPLAAVKTETKETKLAAFLSSRSTFTVGNLVTQLMIKKAEAEQIIDTLISEGKIKRIRQGSYAVIENAETEASLNHVSEPEIITTTEPSPTHLITEALERKKSAEETELERLRIRKQEIADIRARLLQRLSEIEETKN